MKDQGSALRIVAFAVALAVVLGLASVMFQVASAESVESADYTVASLGTIGNYRSIKFTAGQKLDVVSITIYIFVVLNLLMNGFLILLIVHIFNLVFTIIIIAIPVFVLRTVNLQWAVLQL